MIRLRSSRSAIIPDSGATKADGTWVNKKLADSHTVEPVLANATSASATLAAQLPVFDAADAAARTRTSPRVRLTITCSPSEAAPQELPTELRGPPGVNNVALGDGWLLPWPRFLFW
jgi:hypothetical protein